MHNAILPLLLTLGCETENGDGNPRGDDPIDCVETGRETLPADPSSWPAGLGHLVDSYLAASGTWLTSVLCEQAPAYDGPATISIEPCQPESLVLIELGGQCDGNTQMVECSEGHLTLSGWAGNAFDEAALSVLDGDRGNWSHWAIAADNGKGKLVVAGLVSNEMTGTVDLSASTEVNCLIASFRAAE